MSVTTAEKKALKEVLERSKGLPVGIPMPEKMARKLIAMGLAKAAPAFYIYPEGSGIPIRLTSLGESNAKAT